MNQVQFNAIGNHIVQTQDGNNLLVDGANFRLKVSGGHKFRIATLHAKALWAFAFCASR